jgi:SAM-dependent methyltransferase
MAPGHNVDIVLKQPYQWDELSDNAYDVIISGQMFEHVEFPWFTISEMARVLKPGGLLCILVPSMQSLHRYPVNTMNYFADGMIALAKYAGLRTLHASTNLAPPGADKNWYSWIQDTMLVAQKPLDWKADSFDKLNYVCEPSDLEKMASGMVGWKEPRRTAIFLIKRWLHEAIIKPFQVLSGIIAARRMDN